MLRVFFRVIFEKNSEEKLETNISKRRISVNKGFLDVLLRVFCCEFTQKKTRKAKVKILQ